MTRVAVLHNLDNGPGAVWEPSHRLTQVATYHSVDQPIPFVLAEAQKAFGPARAKDWLVAARYRDNGHRDLRRGDIIVIGEQAWLILDEGSFQRVRGGNVQSDGGGVEVEPLRKQALAAYPSLAAFHVAAVFDEEAARVSWIDNDGHERLPAKAAPDVRGAVHRRLTAVPDLVESARRAGVAGRLRRLGKRLPAAEKALDVLILAALADGMPLVDTAAGLGVPLGRVLRAEDFMEPELAPWSR